MKKLDRSQFNNWKEYYHQYQHDLASDYYIPFLNDNNVYINAKNILEIGCGNGGFIGAFSDHSNRCVGFDLKDLDWENESVKYHNLNVFDKNIREKIESKFDLIILRDVIEHIDNNF